MKDFMSPKPFWKMSIDELKAYSLKMQQYDRELILTKNKKITRKTRKTRKIKIRLKKKFIRTTLKRQKLIRL